MKEKVSRQIDVPIWSLAVLILIFSIVAGVLAFGMSAARREARDAHTEVELHRVQSENILKLLQGCLTPSESTPPPKRHDCYEASVQRTAEAVNTVNTQQREMIDELVCYIAQTHRTLPLEGIQCTRKESG